MGGCCMHQVCHTVHSGRIWCKRKHGTQLQLPGQDGALRRTLCLLLHAGRQL